MASWVEFLRDVREKVQASDLFLILSVPVVLSLVFWLPESIQNTLVLNYGNPSVFNLWSSAFVHRGFNHFINNLAAYCLLIGPIYLLFVLAGERKLFRYTFLSFLFIVPFVIALINLSLIDPETGAGFSGIGSAFFGLLPVSLFLFIHNRVTNEIKPSHGVVLFLIATGIIALNYSGVPAAVGIILIATLLTVYDVYRIGLDEVQQAATELYRSEGYFELLLFVGLLFLISPLLLFPQEIAQNGNTVNILSHYMGLVLGFFLPTLYLIYRQRKEKNEKIHTATSSS